MVPAVPHALDEAVKVLCLTEPLTVADPQTMIPVEPEGFHAKLKGLAAFVSTEASNVGHDDPLNVPASICLQVRSLKSSTWQIIILLEVDAGSDFKLANFTLLLAAVFGSVVETADQAAPFHLAYAALFFPFPENTTDA